MTVIFFFGLVLVAYVYLSETGHTPESSRSKPPASKRRDDFWYFMLQKKLNILTMNESMKHKISHYRKSMGCVVTE